MKDSKPLPRPTSAFKIWSLIAGMAVIAFGLTWAITRLPPLDSPFHLPALALIPLVFLGEVAIVSLRFRRDAHVFSLSELPLVAGLFFVEPLGMLGAQLIGNALALGVQRRQPPRKLAFNLSLLTLQAALGVLVFRFFLGHNDPLGTMGSVATLGAVGVGVVAANVLINMAILLSGGGLDRREQINTLVLGAATAGMNASLGLVAVTIIWNQPGTMWTAAVPPVALYLAYRAYIAQREEGQRTQALYEATKALLGAPNVEGAMFEAVRHARIMFEAETAELRVFRSDLPEESFRTAIGPGDTVVMMEHLAAPSREIKNLMMSLEAGSQLIACSNPAHASPTQSVSHQLLVPIGDPMGMVGFIAVREPLTEARTFTSRDLKSLETLASQVSVALENGRLEDSLEQVTKLKDDLRHQAMHDVLTGLGNRALLWEALSGAGQRLGGSDAAVLLLDLDDFKKVNDTFGHHAGDQLLIEVAHRLRACCRPDDTVARLGGDEFAILLERMSSPQDASIVAGRIVAALAEPVLISGQRIVAQASMGITLVESGVGPDELIRQADQAMYSAKTRQKGTVAVFSDSDPSPMVETLQSDLSHALARDELVLHYQPIVDIDTGLIKGVEALVRWNHPRRGLLGPDRFIPLAEETGQIVALGRWVMTEACAQMGRWHRQLEGLMPSLSVNLSPRELAEPDIVEAVAAALRSGGLDAHHLIVEITENVMVEPFTSVLDDLKQLGVRIALDDFGVGYSSLSYLDRLPIDIIKIDRAFVRGLTTGEKSPLVKLILEIGEVLGLDTVAEGVETSAQLERLRQLGSRSAQGFFFARPMEAEAFSQHLVNAHWVTLSRAG